MEDRLEQVGAHVSIVLPTFNRGETLDACLESTIHQTYTNWELLICDDASTDQTNQKASSYVARDRRIRYIRNRENIGLPATRNVGVEAAESGLVFFIEDDLVLEPDCLEILVKSFEELSLDWNVGAVAPSRLDEWEGGDVPRRSILDFAWRASNRNLPTPCSMSLLTGQIRYNFIPEFGEIQEVPSIHSCSLYSKKAILSVGGYDSKTFGGNFLYEESDLNIRLSKNGYKLFFVPSAVAHHRLAIEGGCRVDPKRYAYYFILNHIKFLIKNFGLKSIYMIPSFLIVTALMAGQALIRYISSRLLRASQS